MYIHVVKNTETLFSIAMHYGTTIDRICIDNGISSNDSLQPGQSILILLPKTVHKTKIGENLYTIANNYQVTKRQLLRNNSNLNINSTVAAGQEIIIQYSVNKRGSILTNGYIYPFINIDQLQSTLPYLSLVTPFTHRFRDDATLIPLSVKKIAIQANMYGTETGLIITNLEDNNQFNRFLPGKIFANHELKNKLIHNIINTAIHGKYRYIQVDFEFLPREESQNFVNFIGDLCRQANQHNISVIVALAPKTYADQPGLSYEGHLYNELGEKANYVLLMTYEWGYAFGPPQAVAPIDKVREVISYAVTEIDPNKILMGIPNYGYDWRIPYQRYEMAKSISNLEAIKLAQKYEQQILFDAVAQTPYFNYIDENGIQHVVWFEDPRSILTKLNLVSEYNLAGISVWTAMYQFPPLWKLMNVLFDTDL